MQISPALLSLLLAACAGPAMLPGEADDRDGDGLLDADEAAGWTVTIEGDGPPRSFEVRSAPDRADTDGDGLDDETEWRLRLDPTATDTDGDGLSDADEVLVHHSLGHHVDSDGDSGGDRGFWDGNEVAMHGTSPLLADSDGDGIDDRAERVEWGTHPLIADLARLKIRLKVPAVAVTGSRTDGTSLTTGIGEDVSVEAGVVTSETHSVSESLALARSINASVNGGLSGGLSLADTLSATLGATFGGSVQTTQTTEVGFSLNQSQSRALRQSVSRTRSESVSRSITLDGGYVGVTADLVNEGAVPITLEYASLTALRRNPADRRLFMPVAGLERDSHLTGFPAQTIGPQQVIPDVYFVNDRLDWQDVMPLLDDPGSLVFRVSGVQLVDGEGAAFGHRAVSTRTAAITIDHGLERPEPHRVAHVATNLRFDAVTGEPLGVAITDALALLEVPFETRAVGGRAALWSVDGVASDPADPARAGWFVLLVRDGSTAVEVLEDDFASIRLFAGDHLRLIYDADRDGDGLGYRTEARFGTDDQRVDSDGDGLTDYQEAIEGWAIATANPGRAYSDPTRNEDVDGDGLDDVAEHAAGTHPRRADTDGDGLDDGVDPAPLVVDAIALTNLRGFQDPAAAQLSLTWTWPASPAVAELIWVRQTAAVDGSFAVLPAVPAGAPVGTRVGDGLVVSAPADRAVVRFDDSAVDADRGYRYTAFVRLGDWVPAGTVDLRFTRPAGRYDRLDVQVLGAEVKADDCDPGSGDPELYWVLGVNGQGSFSLGAQEALEVDGYADLSHLVVTVDQPHDSPLTFGGWMRDRDSLDADDDLGRQTGTVHHADGWRAGQVQVLTFVDQAEGPDKCRVEVTWRVNLVERDLQP